MRLSYNLFKTRVKVKLTSKSPPDIILTAKQALETELLVKAIYSHIVSNYPNGSVRESFRKVIEMEKLHINFWEDFLKSRGLETAKIKPSSFNRELYKVLLNVMGRGLTLRLMKYYESQAIDLYSEMMDDSGLTDDEKKQLSKVLEDEFVHEELFINESTKYEGFVTHIKDAVLGMNDGLVEILGVTTGLAGVYGAPFSVAIGGLVVGLAGALSMGLSTFTSSRAQRHVQEGVLKRITSSSKFVAHILKDRVVHHLIRRGYSTKLAEEVANESAKDSGMLSNFIAQEEYGLKEEDLGDPSKAAMYAGIANLLGAFLPLMPYFIVKEISVAIISSLILATIALAITGFLVSILASMPPSKKIAEMIFSGLGSAAITYVIGRMASVLLRTGSI